VITDRCAVISRQGPETHDSQEEEEEEEEGEAESRRLFIETLSLHDET